MRRFLIGVGGLLMLAGAAIWLLVPVKYEAFALLKISRKPPSVLEVHAVTDEDFAVFKRTQRQLIMSGLVLNGALHEKEINNLETIKKHYDDPAEWLRSQLIIDYPDDSEILRVAMKGRRSSDVIKIVNAVVDKYMSEIVGKARGDRIAQEAKLQKVYDMKSAEAAQKSKALHELEVVHKASGTSAAQIRKQFGEGDLREVIANRHRLKQQLRDNAMQIVLQQAREAQASNIPTSAGDAVVSDKLTLPLLEVQKKFLEESLKSNEQDVATAAKNLENIETFSPEVSAKQEELASLRNHVNELRGRVDRASVEKFAEERIFLLDHATVANPQGDYWPRTGYAAAMGIVGLGIFVFGLSRKRRAG